MDATYLVTGILIGIVFGIPVGAVGALTIRRTVEHGALAGLVSGLGCSAADMLYAWASVFGFSFVSHVLAKYQLVVGLVGGLALVALGTCIARQHPAPAHASQKKANLLAFFGSSFAIAVSSPSTVLMFLFGFTVFGVGGSVGSLEGFLLVVGITLGTCMWWSLTALIVSSFRMKFTHSSMKIFNRACGAFIGVFGLITAVKSFVL